MCGIVVTHSLQSTYYGIKSLQHRGREATGIAAIGENRIDVVKWDGPVSKFDFIDLQKILPGTNYHTFMGHVRYATRGRKDKILKDAHPHTIGGKAINRGSHIIILDCDIAGIHNGQIDASCFSEIDKSALTTDCDTEALLHYYREKGAHEILKKIPLAYTVAIADKNRRDVIVMRDRSGIKPGVLGLMDGKYSIASEDVTYSKYGEYVEDLDPGMIYYIDSNGSFRKEKVVEPKLSYCFFEYDYIAHVKSTLNGVSVRRVRTILGEQAADEFDFRDIDLITYLPRCPKGSARACAKKKDVDFLPIFYKMRGERSFQGSTIEDRKNSIDSNLFLLPQFIGTLTGKTVLWIDDSTIRGTNSARARKLLYEEAGVKKALGMNYTPKIGPIGDDGEPRGCRYGVDMPPDDNFIVREKTGTKIRNRTHKEIASALGMEVYFLSVERMLQGFEKLGISRNDLCTFCIGGIAPEKK